MSITNFDGIKAKVAGYLTRDDLGTEIEGAIALFESEFNVRENMPYGSETAALTTVSGTETLSLPSDYRGMVTLSFTSNAYGMEYLPVSRFEEEQYTTTGLPRFYTILNGDTLAFAPAPDAAYQLTINYKQTLPALSSDTASNWLSQKYPHIYIYGALFHMLEYVQDGERANRIAMMHERNMMQLEKQIIDVPVDLTATTYQMMP